MNCLQIPPPLGLPFSVRWMMHAMGKQLIAALFTKDLTPKYYFGPLLTLWRYWSPLRIQGVAIATKKIV
jgi:hypothetical protein